MGGSREPKLSTVEYRGKERWVLGAARPEERLEHCISWGFGVSAVHSVLLGNLQQRAHYFLMLLWEWIISSECIQVQS